MQKSAKPPSQIESRLERAPFAKKIICWDLDETMGRFYGVHARMNNHIYTGTDGIRHGMRQVLEELAELGFTHIVATAAPANQATEVLRQADLSNLISCVFPEDLILRGASKDYAVVTSFFGIPPEEFKSRVIVVGDIFLLDKPSDGVFLYEPDSPYYSAHVTKNLIRLLSENGEGDFWRGFESFFDGSTETSAGHRSMRIAVGFDANYYYSDNAAVVEIRVADERFKQELDPL